MGHCLTNKITIYHHQDTCITSKFCLFERQLAKNRTHNYLGIQMKYHIFFGMVPQTLSWFGTKFFGMYLDLIASITYTRVDQKVTFLKTDGVSVKLIFDTGICQKLCFNSKVYNSRLAQGNVFISVKPKLYSYFNSFYLLPSR